MGICHISNATTLTSLYQLSLHLPGIVPGGGLQNRGYWRRDKASREFLHPVAERSMKTPTRRKSHYRPSIPPEARIQLGDNWEVPPIFRTFFIARQRSNLTTNHVSALQRRDLYFMIFVCGIHTNLDYRNSTSSRKEHRDYWPLESIKSLSESEHDFPAQQEYRGWEYYSRSNQ